MDDDADPALAAARRASPRGSPRSRKGGNTVRGRHDTLVAAGTSRRASMTHRRSSTISKKRKELSTAKVDYARRSLLQPRDPGGADVPPGGAVDTTKIAPE